MMSPWENCARCGRGAAIIRTEGLAFCSETCRQAHSDWMQKRTNDTLARIDAARDRSRERRSSTFWLVVTALFALFMVCVAGPSIDHASGSTQWQGARLVARGGAK